MTGKLRSVGEFGAATPIVRLAAAVVALVLVAANLAIIAATVGTAPAAADTMPPDPSLPETVSSAALPTVQINGVVWDQVIVGNRVFATGQFTSARPAGAAAGVNETPRSNILAYDLTTGNLITSWAPSLNAQGMEIKASADGSTIYVGGDFDHAGTAVRSRIAALDAQTGAVLPWNPGANSRVDAIAVTNGTIYFGGDFTSVGTTGTGFQARTRLAAADAVTGAILPWNPSADKIVFSMVYHPGTGRVIVAGTFNTLNSSSQPGMGSLDGVSGTLQPWAANKTIINHDGNAAIGALTTDGEKIYGIGWAFFGGGGVANFEGAFSADPATGVLDWVDGGRGDNYDITVTGDVLYTVGHPHDWGMLDWNPQYDPYKFQRATAIDKRRSPTLTNAYGTSSIWIFDGMPAAQPLHWLPTLTGGTYTGQGQAAWSVDSNGDYTVLGGEFPKVNGVAQYGLVRFAKKAISPTVDPIQNYAELTPTITNLAPGTVRIGWTAAWDRDNARLKVEVLRGATTATSTVLKTLQTDTTWWNRPPLGFVDATAAPGSSQTYRIRVTDPTGNNVVGPPITATIPAGTTPAPSPYAASVLADNPDYLWRLGEASGTTAYDQSGSDDMVLNTATAAGRNIPGALLNDSDAATNFPGTSTNGTNPGVSPYWQSGPQTFTLETWLKTATTNGGKIIGFGNTANGRSDTNNNDRALYMNTAGSIYFGVRPDMGTRVTINSPQTYRDNQWHHVVASLGADGMKLYVDGNQVAANANVKKAQVYRGYWRIGSDRLTSWPSAPTREAITANLDEIAVYPTALSVGRIRAHYLASGRNGTFPNIPPVASFTSSSQYLDASFDAGASSDDDGSIASYAWDFGDGDTGTGITTPHTYDAGGTYHVTLTVTDNRGTTTSVTNDVDVIDPPPNVLPTAAFGTGIIAKAATFTSTSTDSDGTIVSSAWDFGDTTTGTGATTSHAYSAAGTYPVTLTITDNRGGTDSITRPVTITNNFATDTFERTVANGLGTADNGGLWTLSGTTSAFSVSGGLGRIAGAVNSTRAAYLTSVHETDVDLTSDVSIDTAATGGGAYVSLIGRRVSNGNDYRLLLRYLPGGSVVANLVRTVGNTQTIVATTTVPGLTVSPGDQLRVRFLVAGTTDTTLQAKVWRKGSAEPVSWLLTNTSATPAVLQAQGDVGIMLFVSSSWTGGAPTLRADNLNAGPDSGPPANIKPTASFTSTHDFLHAAFDATSSNDFDGTITSYAWDFGDSNDPTPGTGVKPTHDYSQAGTYTVQLTVTDNSNETGTFTDTVTVNDPPPNVPPSASFTSTVQFLNAAFDATTSHDTDGTITSYAWDFGDSADPTPGTGIKPSHHYSQAGTYTVQLTVTDNRNDTGTFTDTVTVTDPPPNQPPVASFTAGAQFLDASFNAAGSHDDDGQIASYAWDFADPNDPTPGTGVNSTHHYTQPGTYSVTLTVTDNIGDTGAVTHDLTVTSPPPAFAFDTFSRIVANGLGTSEIGGPWTLSGAASGFSVNGSSARIAGAVAGNRAGYLQSVMQTNVDVTADVALDTASTGGGAYVSLIGRRVSNNNDYRLKLRYLPGGSVVAYLARTVGGTETVLASTTVTGLTVNAGDALTARFTVSGTTTTTLRAKVWRAGTTEPQNWLMTTSESTPAVLQGSGGVGILLYVSGSWTGTAPAITVDNLNVIAPTD